MINRKLLAIVGLIVVLAAVLLLIFSNKTTAAPNISISNIDTCTKDINKNVLGSLTATMYNYVKTANNYNHKTTSKNYQSTIRSGSCQTISSSQDTSTGRTNTVTNTSAILDIPGAKQSWKITFAWIPNNQRVAIDLGSVKPTCLSSSELRYGDFNCQKALDGVTGVTYSDPITNYLPHNTMDYSLTLDSITSSGTILDAEILLSQADQANSDLAAGQYEQEVRDYITSVGLDPASYTINYTITNL